MTDGYGYTDQWDDVHLEIEGRKADLPYGKDGVIASAQGVGKRFNNSLKNLNSFG